MTRFSAKVFCYLPIVMLFVAQQLNAAVACSYPIYGGSLSIGNESEVNNTRITGSGNAVDSSTGIRSTVTQTLAAPVPSSFTLSGGGNYEGNASGLVSGMSYNSVTITSGTFPSGTFYINTLNINGNVSFTGGTFYVGTMTVAKERTLSLSTTTRFNINAKFDAGKEIEIKGTGSVANQSPAQFYLYGAAEWEADKEGILDGFIYSSSASSEVDIGKEWRISGAILVAGKVKLDKETQLTYTDAARTTLGSICGGIGVEELPANFNCIESGANSATGHLYTKLVGSAFNSFDVVALKSDGSVEIGYAAGANKNVTVALVDGSGSTACASRLAISPAVSQTLTFTAANQGRKSIAAMIVGKAYANLRCRVTDANQTPNIVGCSVDNFAVRPTDFTLSSGANADSSGTSSSAVPVVKAGASFTLTATADAPGYDTAPKLDTGKIQAHAGAIQAGLLTGSFANADPATGVAAGSAFGYSEVGYFRLAAGGVYDDSFTAVDAANGDCSNDFANSPVGGLLGCKFGNGAATGYFGRFVPDHFQPQAVSHGSFASACSGFSYNGQSLHYAGRPTLKVTAYNGLSPATVTRNYTGAFARLSSGGFTLLDPMADAVQKGRDLTTPLGLARLADTPTLADNGDGSLNYTMGDDVIQYQREANAMIAPFANAVDLKFTAIADADAVAASGMPIALQPGGENIRYGRVSLANAYGSELADLPVAMNVEQYNGSSFVVNGADQCSVATIGIADPLPSDALQAADTCVWDNASSSGAAKCTATAASGLSYREGATLAAGNFNLNLKAPSKTGSLTVNATVANWLKFDWQGAGVANPAATATFGVYKGNGQQIYLREVY